MISYAKYFPTTQYRQYLECWSFEWSHDFKTFSILDCGVPVYFFYIFNYNTLLSEIYL